MAEDDLRFRVTADADEAQRELQETQRQQEALRDSVEESGDATQRAAEQSEEAARSTQELGQASQGTADATGRAADQTQRATRETSDYDRATQQATHTGRDAANQTDTIGRAKRGLTSTIGRVTGAVRGMVQSWLGFTAIAGTIIALIRSIRRESEEANQALTDFGDRVRDLSVNMGEHSDRIIEHAGAISRTERERDTLLEFATELTDRRPAMAAQPEAVERMMSRVRPLAEVTGERGDTIARTMLALEAAGFERPEDAAGLFMTGAMGARDIEQLVQRGGREGLELTESMIRTGAVDPARARRQLPRIFGQLGELDEETRAIGVEEDMDMLQRVRLLVEAAESEDEDRQRIARQIIGADRVDEFVPAMTGALERGGTLAGVRRDVQRARSDEMFEQMMEGDAFRRAFERRQREFRETLRTESPERADVAERTDVMLDELRRTHAEQDLTAAQRHTDEFLFNMLTSFGVSPERAATIRPGAGGLSLDEMAVRTTAAAQRTPVVAERALRGGLLPSLGVISRFGGVEPEEADEPEDGGSAERARRSPPQQSADESPESAARFEREPLDQGAPTTLINIGTQINNADDPETAGLEPRRRQGR